MLAILTPQYWKDSASPGRPSPWIQRKFVVGIVLGLAIWDFYVAVGRICVPAIQSSPGSGFSRGAGIGVLVAFILLWLMFIWSYTMMIVTPPGFARDVMHVERGIGKEAPSTSSSQTAAPGDVVHDTAPHGNGAPIPNGAPPSMANGQQPAPVLTLIPSQPLPSANPVRVPRPRPYLHIGERWCQHCQLAKPDRTHHCRQCGTCVLMFDHHCMWIGQCVGWRNHAIFVVFNFWAGIFCLFNVGIMVASLIVSSKVDAQKIVLAAITGFLGFFTIVAMLPTHVYLILDGKSTLESFETKDLKMTEQAALTREFNWKFCATKEMRRTSKLWESEYGGVVPNDRWKWGTAWYRWREQMGSNWLGWILPIGRPLGDGMHFHANPRFGPNGEWMPVRDWPKVLAVSEKRRANIV